MFEQPSRYTRRVLQIRGRFSSKASISYSTRAEASPASGSPREPHSQNSAAGRAALQNETRAHDAAPLLIVACCTLVDALQLHRKPCDGEARRESAAPRPAPAKDRQQSDELGAGRRRRRRGDRCGAAAVVAGGCGLYYAGNLAGRRKLGRSRLGEREGSAS